MNDLITQIIDHEMLTTCQQMKNILSHSLITKIEPSYCYYNSVNIAVGNQESGKTFAMIREMAKISRVSRNTHLLIYANKTGGTTDKTFEAQKDKIHIPIIYLSHDQLEDFLKEFLEWKELYNEIHKNNLGDKIVEKQKKELFERLHINDFSRPVLHTLIYIEDASETPILKKKKSYIKELMTQCRHINCSFFLIIHFWKALEDPGIKTQVTTLSVFGGYCKQQITYILSQIFTSADRDEVWANYKRLRKHEKMVIDSRAGTVKYNPP